MIGKQTNTECVYIDKGIVVGWKLMSLNLLFDLNKESEEKKGFFC